MKIIETKITRFDGGMIDDFRSLVLNGMAVIKHFDIHNYPFKLVPIRGPVAISNGHKIDHIIVGTDGLFYGLGTLDADPTLQELWRIADPSSPTWVSDWGGAGNGQSGYAIIYGCFVEYKNYFYIMRSGAIMRFDRTGAATRSASYSAVTWANCANGIVHSDDILYIPYDNKIWSLNTHAGTPNLTALTLPDYLKITSIVSYGEYIAIAAVSVNEQPLNSFIFLWNPSTDGTTWSKVINWGTGILRVINVLDGYLIGISDVGGSSATILDRDSIEIKFWSGGTPQLVGQISTRKQTTSAPDAVINPRINFIRGRKMYFSLTITSGGTSPSLNGLWVIGKNNEGRFVYGIERMATIDGSETGVRAAAMIGNYCVMTHNAAGTTSISNAQTLLANIFTATSIYESLIFTGKQTQANVDSSWLKNLLGICVQTEPMPAAGQIVLKYRVDEDINDESAGWTTIFTNTTNNSISHDISGGSGLLPKNYREIQFRIESSGGASPTSLSFKEEATNKKSYE